MSGALGWLLRHPFTRFALVGAAGYLVNLGALWFATRHLALNSYVAGAAAILVAMTFTWAGNRYFTFAARRARGSLAAIGREFLSFIGANLAGAMVNYIVYALLLRYGHAPFDDKYVAQACGVLAGMVLNFSLSHFLVFRTGKA